MVSWMLHATCDGLHGAMMLVLRSASNCTGKIVLSALESRDVHPGGYRLRRQVSDEVAAAPRTVTVDLPRRAPRLAAPRRPPRKTTGTCRPARSIGRRQDVHGHDGARGHANRARSVGDDRSSHVSVTARSRPSALTGSVVASRQPLDFAFGARRPRRRRDRARPCPRRTRRRLAFEAGTTGTLLLDRRLEGQADGRRRRHSAPARRSAPRHGRGAGGTSAALRAPSEVHHDDEIAAAQLAERAGGATHAHVHEAQRLAEQLERLGNVLELQRHAQRALRLLLARHDHHSSERQRDRERPSARGAGRRRASARNAVRRWRGLASRAPRGCSSRAAGCAGRRCVSSRSTRPSSTSEIMPVSSDTTTATESFSSVSPMAARCRDAELRLRRGLTVSGRKQAAAAMRFSWMITAPSWSGDGRLEDRDEQVVADVGRRAECRPRVVPQPDLDARWR